MSKITMPKGEYFIGDLCYVFPDRWDEFCDLTIDGEKCVDGAFEFKDGTKFVSFRTMYGDGVYLDQYGNEYCVDAGLIGCVKTSDIVGVSDTKRSLVGNISHLGKVITFNEEFECFSKNGQLYFGHVGIDTVYEEESEEENY